MSLEITGKLIKILDEESGTSKAGKEWKKQSFVIDTGAQFSPEVCFSLFGEKKTTMLQDVRPGEEIKVAFNLSSREYNGKYYHNIDAWKIEKTSGGTQQASAPVTSEISAEPEVNDDLPF